MNIFRLFVICVIFFIHIFSPALVFSTEMSLQKASVYTEGDEIANWHMSEKLDGIRGYWNGEKFLTRKGKTINAPKWFVKNFPPFELDGELWGDRESFEFVQSTVLDKVPSESWEKITYNIFEVPNEKGSFSSRLEKVKQWFEKNQNKQVRVIPQIVCTGEKHLQGFLTLIESKGGEGVIIKDPRQEYRTGRSQHILKVKNFKDMEGIVISINKGKGKYKNMMGSLTIELENQIVFKLGSGFSDFDRANPPKLNSQVTFKYYGFTKNGIPKFASFLHIRKD